MAKMTKLMWIEKAFEMLIENGVNSISAEKIAKNFGISRGSFYHHFGSSEEFQRELLETWYKRGTIEVLARNKLTPHSSKLEVLRNFAWSLNHELDVAVRSWALYNPLAKSYQEKVDTDRIGYITDVYSEVSGKSTVDDDVKMAAQLSYLSFIGIQNIQPRICADELDSFRKRLQDMLAQKLCLTDLE
jgi:AcrR family transcriptional regulator